MKTALLLEKLEGQLATLRQRCAPVSQFATLSARFDRHLFQTRATTLQACLDEAGDNLAALRHAVEQQQLPQVAWLAEHLAAQLEAIAREATAWSLREWDSAPPKIARWQRKRIQHQDFERRLREMVAERRARLARATDLVEQQTLHREVEAYEARPGTLPPCAGKNRKQVSAFNPLAMERVCHWKMPLTMSNWPSI